jgi:hypothetical protein
MSAARLCRRRQTLYRNSNLDASEAAESAKSVNDWAQIFQQHQEEWRSKKLTDLFEQLEFYLKRLQLFLRIAKSHDWSGKRQQAVEVFYAIAAEATALLSTLPEDELRSVARKVYSLPVLLGAHPEALIEARELVDRLELGALVPIDMRAKGAKNKPRFSLKTPANRLAIFYRDRVEFYRSRLPDHPLSLLGKEPETPPDALLLEAIRLPPYSKASLKEWFNVSWKFLMFDYGDHPENDPGLRKLGEPKAKTKGRGKPGSKTWEHDIRDGIRQRFRAAFENLTPSF